MTGRRGLGWAAILIATTTVVSGCSTTPSPVLPPAPAAVGDDYPGSCLPPELRWPTDFLESIPGETEGVGTILGLRLEHIDGEWVWRVRSAADRVDMFGERIDDPSAGRETLLDVQSLKVISSQDVQLTEAESMPGTHALEAAMQSGEEWPSPLIIEMARVEEAGKPVWQITMCDTETNAQSVVIVP